MVYRILYCYVRLLTLYPHCQILQTVIYLSETTSELVFRDSYQDAHITHQFRVIRVWEEEAETLMNLPGFQQLINQVFRRDLMQGSVIYDQIFQEGEARGKRELLIKQLKRRVGELSTDFVEQVEALSLERVEDLGVALLDFASMDDWFGWLG
jgi:predicted transposase YdaD